MEVLHLAGMIHACPRPLISGDRIALAAPARFATAGAIEAATQAISAAGFEPILLPGLANREGQFGGTDAHRAQLLNEAFRDPEIRAVWALRGGYGCARLLPLLDGLAFRDDPTWLIGFSDVTALHGWASRQGVCSLHAPVAGTLASTENPELLWDALRHPEAYRFGRDLGVTDGRAVVGGNLSVLFSLQGTPWFPDVAQKWLLLEDLDEFMYHIDRMFNSFRIGGVLDEIQGILCGNFSDLKDNTRAFGQSVDNPFGRTAAEIILDHLPSHKPVAWGLPVGHGFQNRPVVLD